MSLASFATDVPDPIESPTLAKFSAGASFVPSPVTATISPLRCKRRTSRCLSSGRARDIIFRACTRSSSSSSLIAANSTPVISFREESVSSCHKPMRRAISRAVAGVSPVTILMSIPAFIQRATAAGTSSRTGSAIAATATNSICGSRSASSHRSAVVSAYATASVRIARPWNSSNCSFTWASLPSGIHIARTISGAPFTQIKRFPVVLLCIIVAIYLRSVVKVIRSTIGASSRKAA